MRRRAVRRRVQRVNRRMGRGWGWWMDRARVGGAEGGGRRRRAGVRAFV
jgi:hypothetical protein